MPKQQPPAGEKKPKRKNSLIATPEVQQAHAEAARKACLGPVITGAAAVPAQAHGAGGVSQEAGPPAPPPVES